MRFLLIFHAVLTVAASGGLALTISQEAGLSLLAGGGVAFLNLAVSAYAWPRLLEKKLVAVSIAIIVFKFALLAWILYVVVRSNALHLGWFALGLGLVVPTALAMALRKSPEET